MMPRLRAPPALTVSCCQVGLAPLLHIIIKEKEPKQQCGDASAMQVMHCTHVAVVVLDALRQQVFHGGACICLSPFMVLSLVHWSLFLA